ncbi:MAG: bifunctional 5,10-methylene-tetrahydrofolate dehydrogenase/5,10-methylene-tetrahydrofolate cyclohydrolase [Bacteroidetes bacterium]|jgi:methylenetetrahydrofolate dehydrogenase (NADP+) / methenyltetrahydrofolate cyclohydrolase|nr:bifunctional 5,10-methylene-tetrahydrofolate dehydrogenase/5,10-methylene-tetrahydrofolate cyclohydrolase [Bacteroidota bacterium]MBT6687967.1 bifunctional 5,10-methylene-tetrahydrofolate dehydrogenase/5,10-methylene-tetrahydrofolate cyclohydrolase [Bacteroidota bacterium]MBT7143306.1 bifunctional 5,10-methylene-tetrahydrofolate dehydrogenase/5,10-methylene-tetrahydrofolate cyclohydrolase [Bacteroidota bacterium]MBT7490287.1 bifunctional 5,10-methylene-tetrahydrofolate dehydrogenase/5,10-meth
MQIIDGKKISSEIKNQIAEEVNKINENGGKVPHLAAIIVGNDPASETYVGHKTKACEQVGFDSTTLRFDENISENKLLAEISQLNQSPEIDGFIVQLPLPDHISEEKITLAIDPSKDVDGFHPENVGRMVIGLPAYLPATPFGIVELIKKYEIETVGKNCVIIGRSNIVGTPLSLLMMKKAYPGNSTVTVCHSRTKNIKEITKNADILIVAIGKLEFLTADMVKNGAVVIDVGMHRVKSDKTKSGWKLKGDVKYDEVSEKCEYITPVPGGVGPMTIVSLLKNTLLASKKEIYS